MKWFLAALPVALTVAAPAPAETGLVPCAILASEGTLSITPGDSLAVEIREGSVRRVLAASQGRASGITEFAPVGPGASVRNVATPDAERPGFVRSIVNLALVEPGGAVILFTSIVSTATPYDAPLTRRTTLACPG